MQNDANDPVSLTTVANEVDAGAIITALAAYDIEANATGGFTAGFRAEAPGKVQVWVRRKDLKRAQDALREIGQTSQKIDWSQVDVGEPLD